MQELISDRAKKLEPYVPGEQPIDREYIKLNANENPYEPFPQVILRVCDFVQKRSKQLSLYPDPSSYELRCQIAAMLNRTGGVLSRAQNKNGALSPSIQDKIPFTITPDMVYVGNGSDEVLSFVFYAFFNSTDRLVMPEFSYSFYPVYCGFYDIPRDAISLNSDWTLNTNKIVEHAIKNHSCTIIANPNAPTAIALTRDQIRAMLERAPKDRVFVVDEAYIDFGGESCIPLLAEFENLVVVRTFSKSLCGAGFRTGYMVSSPNLVNIVTTVKNSMNHFPLDAITQVAAQEICKCDFYYAECAQKIVQERDAFIEFLKEQGWYVTPSKTNFVFTKKDGVNGKSFYEQLKKDGILVRRFDTRGIEDYLRITIGTHEQMQILRKSFL